MGTETWLRTHSVRLLLDICSIKTTESRRTVDDDHDESCDEVEAEGSDDGPFRRRPLVFIMVESPLFIYGDARILGSIAVIIMRGTSSWLEGRDGRSLLTHLVRSRLVVERWESTGEGRRSVW